MRGQTNVLEELVRVRLEAARASWDRGGTILHACVKNNQLETLKFLIEAIKDDQFINMKDDFGFTILHLAVSYKQLETVSFLLTRPGIEVNLLTSNGYTALDILNQSPRDLKDLDIAENLRAAGASRATANSITLSANNHKKESQTTVPVALNYTLLNRKRLRKERLASKKNAMMVVASLIATMTFAAGLTPPGSLWQDNSKKDDLEKHEAGKSIIAYHGENTSLLGSFSTFVFLNTVGLVSSLSVILLLITGLPFKRGFFMWVLTLIMWVAISAMTLTYLIAMLNFTPEEKFHDVAPILVYSLIIWIGVMGFVVLGHTLYLFILLYRKLSRRFHRRRHVFLPLDANHTVVSVL